MAKRGMKRPEVTHTKPRNTAMPVPEIQGKAKHGKKAGKNTLSSVYPELNTDLATDNYQNDFPDSDIQDME